MTGLPGLAADLRGALEAADYRYDAVADLLGATAQAALGRNETTPALHRTADGSPLATLVRLWMLQDAVTAEAAERALPGLVDRLCAAEVLTRSVGEVAARVDVRPYGTDDAAGGNLWIAADLTPGLDGLPVRTAPEHVLGISSASTSLAQLTVRAPVDRALDLGTGCGVQALHLARHCRRVVATDVNPRALWLARLNAALNEVDLDLREGSFFGPVATDEFDLVVTNPPFVISPATGERLIYRDSGLPGDRVVEQVVREVPRHLAPGGHAQVLANWLIRADQPWQERLGGWIDPSLRQAQDDAAGSGQAACDAWVVQREAVDLPTYVELWLKDSGHHPSTGGDLAEYRRRYDTWLAWFDEIGAEGVGFGWITLRRPSSSSGAGSPDLRLEEWPWEVEQPIGPEVAAHFRRLDRLRILGDDELLASRPVLRADVRQETFGPAGAADPARIVLRQQAGMRRAREVDTVEAALAGACDGELTVGQVLAALEDLGVGHGLVAGRVGTVRSLLAEGWLELHAP